MHAISRWVLAACASPLGVVVLGALDSTLFFSLPFGIDAVVVILAARMKDLAWIVPLLATAGGVAGAALTFWMGVQIGEHGLDRYVPAKRLERIRNRINTRGTVALAVLDLIPPPFPFTPFVLAAGALDVSVRTFFVTLAVTRMVRFGAEAALAVAYGSSIIAWIESDTVQNVVLACLALAIVLTAWSLLRLIRSTRTSGRPEGLRARA